MEQLPMYVFTYIGSCYLFTKRYLFLEIKTKRSTRENWSSKPDVAIALVRGTEGPAVPAGSALVMEDDTVPKPMKKFSPANVPIY